ncbi:Slc35b3 protein [Tritrichomonas foetus]|uniref:Slc35b3 protein n=1 Tax=Tritrichomonas foetus TaxID=1144522 RepID=A0A1J4IZE1_9EUKA|nr:Slc35b3 protein [Tritrichomonas foetus]|eukprot:OHS92782.1 Slc35b3 protein [Tritrichomonas foetus]
MKGYNFRESIFLTFVQFVGYAALSFPTLLKIISGRIQLRAPLHSYIITSLALAASMGLTNFATLRLSYATSVLFKSSKLIPVMIGNIIFLKKKPKVSEAVSVVLMVLGLIGISLGDFRGKNKFDMPGIITITLSLISGAVASNMEDKVMSHYGASQDELISMLYSIGALFMGVLSIFTGQMTKGIDRMIAEPSSIMYVLFFSCLGSIGIQFVYLNMKVFGSLLTVMVTSLRKAFTVILSFLIFKDKKFTSFHAVAIVLIATGMAINVHEKATSKKKVPEDQMRLLEDTDNRKTSGVFQRSSSADSVRV